jgi:hypothetical protein
LQHVERPCGGRGHVSRSSGLGTRDELFFAQLPQRPGPHRGEAFGLVAVGGVVSLAEVGLPAARAVLAYSDGRRDDVVNELLPIRTVFQHFGGSHAQRDVLQRTLTESAIRTARFDLARALLDERLSQRDTSVYGLLGRAPVLARQGSDQQARQVEESARANRARFVAAAA